MASNAMGRGFEPRRSRRFPPHPSNRSGRLTDRGHSLLSDFRYAVRCLLKTARFSVVAILVLALGIGATAAMFSVVYNVLLRPLAYPRPERLVFVQERSLRR